jgi:hypothetical protein
MIYKSNYAIRKWGTAVNTYDAVNIFTNEEEYTGTLKECLDYAKGIDNHKEWATQDWDCGHLYHLPELSRGVK